MRFLGRIVIFAVTIVFLTLSLSMAASKFINKDTAKNRQDQEMGTRNQDDDVPITIQQKKHEDTAIETKRKKKEEKDWYDKVIISVEPKVDTN